MDVALECRLGDLHASSPWCKCAYGDTMKVRERDSIVNTSQARRRTSHIKVYFDERNAFLR